MLVPRRVVHVAVVRTVRIPDVFMDHIHLGYIIFLPSHQDYCMFSSGSQKTTLHLTGVIKIPVLGVSNNTNLR